MLLNGIFPMSWQRAVRRIRTVSAVRRAASRARSGAPPAISVADQMTNGKIAHANLSREEKRKLLLSSLEDHRHLLRSAIKAMAEGDLRQALPIAVSIRTLVHETGRTKPLLKSLKPITWTCPSWIFRPSRSTEFILAVFVRSRSICRFR